MKHPPRLRHIRRISPPAAGTDARFSAELGPYEARVRRTLRSLDEQRVPERLWAKDPSLWSGDPEVRKKIENRLGWLTVLETMTPRIGGLSDWARGIRDAGIRRAVLLGMGGSSLCPEVLKEVFGAAPGYPAIRVLDSTDPAAIRSAGKNLDLRKTLFIVSSKSGDTIEVECLRRHFYERVRAVLPEAPGRSFIAVTDPGTPLERLAREQGFRKIFLNPPGIGGRYSALSYFGLAPAAIIGMNLEALLQRAVQMACRCGPSYPAGQNPAIRLGAILGTLASSGRDKVTLLATRSLLPFGAWVEQLLAESTGKEGRGLVPIDREAPGPPRLYGRDRLFVALISDADPRGALEDRLKALVKAGHPVVRILLAGPVDLAGEFFRWEMATAVAGHLMGINPFDEPNVSESKEKTRNVLKTYQTNGKLPFPANPLEAPGIRLYDGRGPGKRQTPSAVLKRFLKRSRPGDYLAINAFIEPSRAHETLLQKFRRGFRARFKRAAAAGFGPRYLHSTGQLHKGGPAGGLFLLITADDARDLPVPGEAYTFGTLKQAQALGDAQALAGHGRRMLHVHLTGPVGRRLRDLLRAAGLSSNA